MIIHLISIDINDIKPDSILVLELVCIVLALVGICIAIMIAIMIVILIAH